MSSSIRERDVSRLTQKERPLVLARLAIDVMCEDRQSAVARQLADGARLEDLITEPLVDPVLDAARTVLGSFRPTNGDTTHAWTDWFHLQTATQTSQLRIFHPAVFHHKAGGAIRKRLHATAHDVYSTLLGDALDLQRHAMEPMQARELTGAVSELAIAALLTKRDRRTSGVRISSTPADMFQGVDLRYVYSHESASQAKTVSISVKTSRGGEAHEKQRNRVASIVANEVLSDDKRGQRYIAQLIAISAHETLPQPQEQLVLLAAEKTKEIIHQQVQKW